MATDEKKKVSFLSMYKKKYVLYGLTNTFSTLRSQMNSNYQQFFLNSVVMLPAVMAANIATISTTVSLVVSLLLGFVMQKANPKMGRFRFFMLLGGIVSAVTGIMMFTPISAEKFPSSFVYIWYMIAIVGGVGYSIFYTPYTGCISLLAPDPDDRTSMTGVRAQMNSAGKLFWSFFQVSILAALCKIFGETWGYTAFSTIISVALMLGVFIVCNLIKGMEKPDERDSKTGKSETVPILTMIKLALTRPMLCAVVGSLGKSVCYSMVYGVMAYYYTFVIGDKSGMTVYLSASTFILMFGGMAAPMISKKIGIKMTCIVGYAFYALALVLSFIFGTNGTAFTILMSIGIFGYSLEHSISGALIANVVDYSYYTTGINARAFLYQVTSMAANLSNVIKTAALGYGLAYFGFNAKEITERAIMGIRLITAFVPTFFLIIGIIAYALFPVTEKKLSEAKAAFEARQAGE